MYKKFQRIFKSISTKVIFVIIFLVLPLNLIAILQNNAIINTLVEKTRISSQNFADTYMSEIGTRMENTQSLLYYFLTENADFNRMKLQKENSYDYQSAKYKFYYSLKNMASMTDGGDGYFYYMKKLDDILAYDDVPAQSLHLYQQLNGFIKEQLEEGIQNGWHIYELNSHKYLFFIWDKVDYICGGWLNLDTLITKIENGLDYSDSLVNFSEEKADKIDEEWVRVSSGKKGIYLNISLKHTEIIAGLSIYQKILQAMVFMYLILIPALYIFLRLILLLPLKRINCAHRQIQGGNQDFRIMAKGNSVEYQEAYQSFNQMAENLKTLKIESYEKEITKQQMELRNLQLQIRPHFLLNTFNLIYTMAQRKEEDAIQDIILYLSDYFRYIFRNDKDLDLFPKELKLIKGYMKMISIRYSGNIEAEYKFDPEIMFVRIPPLLIHNFIENSAKYGIKRGIVLHISVIGVYKDKTVTFYVIDDGNGMNEEVLEYNNKVLNGEIEPESQNSHIGLLNSIRRLKYFYGDEANIVITSEKEKMTCVKITFPYNLEVNDEPFDNK